MLIGIEGYWSAGKSTVGRHIAEQLGAAYIPEPDHLVSDETIVDLDMWYRNAFLEQHAAHDPSQTYVTDRTPLSVIAFMQAMGRPIAADFIAPLKAAQDAYDVVFVLPTRHIAYGAKYDPTPFVRDPAFKQAYQHSLRRLLEQSNTTVHVLTEQGNPEAISSAITAKLM